MGTRLFITVFAALLIWLQVDIGWAQETDERTTKAEDALQTGKYQEARRLYKVLLEGGQPEAAEGYFETYLQVGDYEGGLSKVNVYLNRNKDDAYLVYTKGRLLAAVGRYEEAEEAFRTAGRLKPDYWRNALELAFLLDETGRKSIARSIYNALYQRYKQGIFRTPESLGVAGQAAARIDEYHDANAAHRTAYQLDERNVQNLYWWAELFRAKYNDPEAQRTFEEALNINPNRADLYVGYAQSFGSFALKEEWARKALEQNPNSVAALNIVAGLRILDGQYDVAEATVKKALTIHPASIQTLAHLASIHHLRGDTTAFASVEKQVLEINPRPSDFYVTLTDNAMLRFRYPDAVVFARKATSAEWDNAAAQAILGTSLLRAGRFEEAERHFDQSFRRDPFNLQVGNTLTLLEEFEAFEQLESEHFRLVIHKDESAILGQRILDVAEACYADLSARYPYTPADKIFLEAYNDRDDFAVRIAGVPHLGLLGVSFGDVVALNTPQAQAGNEYNWARTLWHELAHTMAIGVSKHHVPRWFTEGLSVYEERRARPEWGREMDLEFFSAFDQDKLLPLELIGEGFTRPQFPGQVLLSYYHASKIITYIEKQHGFDAIIDMLTLLGQGYDEEAVFQQVVRYSREAFDQAFRADLELERAQFEPMLRGLPDMLSEEDDTPLLEKTSRYTGNPFLKPLQEGHEFLQSQRYEEAEEAFKEALAIYAGYIGPGNAYLGLASVYEAQGKQRDQIAVLERFLSVSEYGSEQSRTLGAIYQKVGDLEKAISYYDRSMDVEPYDLPTHDTLAQLYEQQGDYKKAIQARRAILALNPVDKATAYYDLALSLYNNNDIPQAKRVVLQSLELAPGYREAQKLLLACVEPTE